jgi:hypothetical protein
MNAGFSHGRTDSAKNAWNRQFFSKLFSRAEKSAKSTWLQPLPDTSDAPQSSPKKILSS